MNITDLSYMETVTEATNIEGGYGKKKWWKKYYVNQSNYNNTYQNAQAYATAVSIFGGDATANATAYNTNETDQSNRA
jgi:hypothetical protein